MLASYLYGINIAQTGPSVYSRVSLILYSSDIKILSNFTTYHSSNELLEDLSNLEQFYDPSDEVTDIYM